ncbi:hypothetical protein WJX82_006661 [Trebouxia sp. C0006]
MVLRLEPHCVVSNRTGTPLQIMHFNTGNKVQRLGGKATGVQPSWGQQPQRAPPGLKGVVAKPQQDWTSCIDVPTGALGVAVHWSMKSDLRAVCLRFGPQTAGSGVTAPWSHPVEASFPGGVDRHVAIPVQPPQPSETARPGEASSAEEADQQSSERSVATLLTGTGPSWELHGPRVARRLRHRTRQSGNGGDGPEAMDKVEVVILRFSLAACNPGCLHLVLESVSPKAPYLLENHTAHPFKDRQAGLGDLPFQPLPAYSAAGFAWQVTEKSYPREIVDREQELMSTAGLQSLGGGAGLGRGGLDRELRIVPSRKGPNGELAVLGLASADNKSGNALYLSLIFGSLDISYVDHLPEELIAVTIQGLSFSMAMGIGPEGTFQRMQLSLQNLQIDDQLSASRFPVISKTLQISLSETLVWRAAEMMQRLDLTSLTAPEDEEHTEAATDVPMQMSLVSISSLAAKVSFRGDLAARPRWAGRTLSWALDIANFETVPVQLTGLEMENSTMLWSVFISEVGQNIKGQLVGPWMIDLLCSELSRSSIEIVGYGMVEGGAALGMGIYRGFTGLVTKPVEGAKSKGVGGFFKGVGKGVVGAIAQPISGGLDFASSAFEGIDATKDQLIGHPRAGTTNRRLRLPRAIGGVTAFLGSDGTEKEEAPKAKATEAARHHALHGLHQSLGYRALETVVIPDAEQPGSKEVLCLREDLCSKTGIFDSPIWKFEPPIMQGGLNVQRLKTYYPDTWHCSCWQVNNPAGTFLANRSLSKPSNQAALSASGMWQWATLLTWAHELPPARLCAASGCFWCTAWHPPDAIQEWRDLRGAQGDETFKRQLAAADASRLHTVVDNKLGVAARMELDFGDHMQTAELPAKASTPVLQPLPQPPLRHSKSLQGASDVQQMQQIVCGLTFEDTLNNAHTGTWGVRTRAIMAHSAGKVEWVECLILELKGPIGTAGKLKLQLVDTAANTGAGQPIAHASVDLDMRQWKDSQTYQAEVPLANDQGKEGGKLLLRYTLQQQFHQDLKSLHTDAWLEHSSSAGQRALQVGDDSKWVVIASSGLQRAAANVGAGGMLKKNLPDKHKRRSAAVVLPLVNTSELALEVCVVDLAESDWQMLPRQARSISSDQVQMQHQQSLSKRGSGVNVTEEQLFEHERFMPLAGWSSRHLLPTERNRYSRQEDGMNSTNTFPQIRLPDGWMCGSPWEVELSPYVDKEGWAYAPDWAAMDWPPQYGAQKRGVVDFTRRRRWLRRRRAIAAENSKKEVQRTLLGTVQPGDSIPVPYGWQKAGKQLAVRPVLDAERPDTHGWSLGASDGDHNIRLDAMDEGLTRLVASLPTDEAESKGKEAVTQGKNSLAAKLEYRPLMDWKVVAAAPLVIENQLPIKGTYLIWETPKDGGNMVMRQSGAIDSGQRVHIYSADIRRSISLQFYPDGYDLVEPQPVLVSEGYSSHQAGTQGKQWLPEKLHVARAGSEPQEIFLDRDIDMEAWQMQDKQLDPGEATAAKSSVLRVMETRPKPADPNLMNPRGCRQVGPGAVTMMAYPMQRMTAFKQQGDRPQFFGLCLRIGESGWAPPLPLESSDSSSQADDMNTKPVLLRAQIPEWGTVHEVVARVEMAGVGFERTMVLRLEPHCVISNRTGTPLHIMHFNTGNKVQRLGGKATGVQPSRSQQPQRASPGLKGVVANPQQDWTSCIDVPTGALGVAVHWSMTSDSRAMCLRLSPQTAGSGANAPWSHPIEASFPGGVGRHVAIPVQPPQPSETARPGEASSAEEADQQSSERSVATLLTGTGPSWELHGPRVARRLRHRTRQSGNGGGGPEAMEEVEVVILRFSLAVCNPGCLHLVLESVSPKAPYLLENRTAHPFQYRQAGVGDLPFQPLPAYSAAGCAWQVTEKSYPREGYGRSSGQAAPLCAAWGGAGAGRKGPNGELAVLGLASADDKSGNALYVSLSFGSLDISCVDHLPEELIAVTIQGLSFSMAMGIGPEGTFQRMQLSLQNLQIDDQLSASRFPVVLSPADIAEEASEYHPLLSLAVISQPGLARSQTHYPLISFQISNTLQISLSETLVWRAAEMVQRLDLTSLTAPEDEEHTEAATDVPMQMSLVFISSLAAKVSFRGDLAARPRWAGRTLSWALDMANFENVPVQLTGFEMENSTMLWSVFISEVGQNIKGQLVGVALSFLSNFGILSGASGVLGALSSGVASAALDDRFAVQRAQQKQERSIEGVGDGMVEGGAALGMGIYRGFTGLVTKPVEGAKSKGVGGFFKGVGKGVVGAIAQPISGGLDFASSAFEGIDASKDQLIGRPRAGSTNRRLRLPRAIGGDGKVTALFGSDGTEKEARVEEVGQALLRRTQDAGGVGPRRKGKRSRFHMDAYEEHMLLPDDQVVILTNQCIMNLRAPGFAQVHRAAESGASPTTLMEVPPAEVRWAIPWQDLLTVELRWGNREGPYPDRLTVHRKGKPSQQEEEPLAHELRCWPNVPQADQIHLIALKVQRKYYSEPSRESQRWASRHDQLVRADKGLSKQELPATMLSMDYTRVWYTDKRNTQQCISPCLGVPQ